MNKTIDVKKISLPHSIMKTFVILAIATVALYACEGKPKVAEESAKVQAPSIDYFQWNKPLSTQINEVQYDLANDYIRFVPILYRDKNFTAIEQQINSLLSQKNEAKANELNNLYYALGNVTDLKHKDLMQEVMVEWLGKSKSHIPYIVRGIVNLEIGWNIRGGGWASKVPKEDMQLFHEYLHRAKKDLEKAYTLEPNDPNSSSYLLMLGRGLSLPQEEMENYFQRGIAVSPYHFGLYEQMFKHLTPNWGGSRTEMMQFAQQCLAAADLYPTIGLIMAKALAQNHADLAKKDERFSLELDQNWELVEMSFANVFSAYPDSILPHLCYAYYAYKAKKYDIAATQFDLLGNRWYFGTCWHSLDRYNRARGRSYNNYGVELMNQKLYPRAQENLLKAVKHNPTAGYYYNLTLSHWREAQETGRLDSWKKAEESLLKVIEIDPEYQSAKKDLRGLQEYLRKLGI